MKFAVQLYTLRDDIKDAESFIEVLKKVKEIGFDGVELCFAYGLSYEELKAKMDEIGLVMVGRHASLDADFIDNFDDVMNFSKVFDCKTVGIGGANIKDKESFDRAIEKLKIAAEKSKENGISFYFHNHWQEFENYEGIVPMDYIKEICELEVDTYWSFHAGVDTPKFLRENKDRIVHIHIKDGNGQVPCALGEGNATVKESLDVAKEIGLEWVILENDLPKPTGLEDIARSMEYLKKWQG